MRGRRAPSVLLVILASACGPQVNLGDDGTRGSDTAASDDDLGGSLSASAGPAGTSGPTPGDSTVASDATIGTNPVGTSDDDDDEDDGPLISFTGDGCGIDPPEGASFHCSLVECNTFEQDCPEGEKCMPWSNDGGPFWNSHRCSPIDPTPAQLGEACHVEASHVSGIDDCDFRLMCLHVDPDLLQGVCVALCGGSEARPTCEGETQCMFRYDGALAVCVDTCDPIANDCGIGDCIPIDAGSGGPVGFGCFVDTADAMPGEICEHPGGCAPGTTCNFGSPECPDAIGCCASYCDLDAPDPSAPCLPGQLCTQIFGLEDADPEVARFGLCMAP